MQALVGPGLTSRRDGWENAFTGVGSLQYDKRLTGAFYTCALSWQEGIELWRGNPLAARIVETWPNEMLRQGWDLVIPEPEDSPYAPSRDAVKSVAPERATADAYESKELAEQVGARLEELDIVSALWRALAYERALGGGAIMLGVSDFRSMSEPLNWDNVQSLDWITVLEPREIEPRFWYTDPRQTKFGEPSIYQVGAIAPGPSASGEQAPELIYVHESRIIAFPGIRVSRYATGNQSAWWGDSILTRINGILRDHGMGYDAAAILLHDFAQAVYKIQGLAAAMAEDRDEEIKTRTKALELSRSTARAIIIDAEEEFERKQTPMTGLPELLDRLSIMLAAAADMPLTLLMGVSPGGLNATGESDIRFFYDRVRAQQVRRLKPALEKIIRLVILTLGPEPDKWCVEFRPLWQQSEKEAAEARRLQAETDKIYMEAMVVSPEDVAQSRFGGDEYSFDTKVDFAARDKMEEEAKAAEEMAMQQSIESARAASGEAESGAGREDARYPISTGWRTPVSHNPPFIPRTVEMPAESGRGDDYIEKVGEKWFVRSKSDEKLGEHNTREEAVAQLRAIEAAKR